MQSIARLFAFEKEDVLGSLDDAKASRGPLFSFAEERKFPLTTFGTNCPRQNDVYSGYLNLNNSAEERTKS